MDANEVAEARKKWISERQGVSPAMGNRPENMVKNGTIIKEVIATFDNGVQVVGYMDKQNRFAGTNYEVPDIVSLAEYARLHGKAEGTVRQKAIRGGFKTARKIGRNWAIDRNEPYVDLRERK